MNSTDTTPTRTTPGGNPMTKLDMALEHAARGWHVFPLVPNSKVPMTGHGQNDATTDPATIRAWWKATPDANIGVHCAPSGLYLVDVDCKHGQPGYATWERLVAEHGATPTLTSRTTTGGLHVWFKMPEGEHLTNTQGSADPAKRTLGPGIDTRGNGYVVAPGSTIDGRAYEWVVKAPIAPLAPWIADKVRSRQAAPAKAAQSNVSPLFATMDELAADRAITGPTAAAGETIARVVELRDQLAAAPEGEGNGLAASLAFRAGQYAGAGQLSEDDVVDIMLGGIKDWTYRRPEDESAMENTIRRQVATGAQRPRAWVASQERAARDTAAAFIPAPRTAQAPPEEPEEIDLSVLLTDLTPYLDGTYVAPSPSIGIVREDGKHVLYPGKWHTLIGPTASGKSWFAAQCVFDELCAGNTVLYMHFEESLPAGTVGRLLSLGLSPQTLRERFLWLDTEKKPSGAVLAALAEARKPQLVVLDGINAACSFYGWPVNEVQAVGMYRKTLVTPFAREEAAVLSLGHPPKARDRQDERHGFGSTAWLDEVDGVGFRIVPSKTSPIARGKTGYANISTVKDRYGQVEALGRIGEQEGWYDLGSLRVDSEGSTTRVRLLEVGETAPKRDGIDSLCDGIVEYLSANDEGAFGTVTALEPKLRAAGVKFRKADLTTALERLVQRGQLEWPEVEGYRKPRPGRLLRHLGSIAGEAS